MRKIVVSNLNVSVAPSKVISIQARAIALLISNTTQLRRNGLHHLPFTTRVLHELLPEKSPFFSMARGETSFPETQPSSGELERSRGRRAYACVEKNKKEGKEWYPMPFASQECLLIMQYGKSADLIRTRSTEK